MAGGRFCVWVACACLAAATALQPPMEVSLARGSARDSVVVSFAASPSPSVAEYSVELDSSITFNSSALRRVVAPSPDAIAFTGLELRTWFARVGAQAAAEIAYRPSTPASLDLADEPALFHNMPLLAILAGAAGVLCCLCVVAYACRRGGRPRGPTAGARHGTEGIAPRDGAATASGAAMGSEGREASDLERVLELGSVDSAAAAGAAGAAARRGGSGGGGHDEETLMALRPTYTAEWFQGVWRTQPVLRTFDCKLVAHRHLDASVVEGALERAGFTLIAAGAPDAHTVKAYFVSQDARTGATILCELRIDTEIHTLEAAFKCTQAHRERFLERVVRSLEKAFDSWVLRQEKPVF